MPQPVFHDEEAQFSVPCAGQFALEARKLKWTSREGQSRSLRTPSSFYEGLHRLKTQKSLTFGSGAQLDIFPGLVDPNPILDIGCPCSVGGSASAAVLSMAMGITLVLEPLDSEPFYHGYGPQCKEKKATVATWNLPVTDLLGHQATIQLYIVRGDDPFLLGNDIISVSTLVEAQNLLLIPENVVAPVKISLPTYTTSKPICLRTMLHVVPAQNVQLKMLHSSSNSASSAHSPVGRSQISSQKRQAKAARVLAVRLHTFTHLTAKDMKEICNVAGVLNPTFSQALDLVVHKCTCRKRSGRPIHARKVSFTGVLSDFNEHLQVDLLFIR